MPFNSIQCNLCVAKKVFVNFTDNKSFQIELQMPVVSCSIIASKNWGRLLLS
uniref:Uncharacterized protein n=1 Tax=Rhizophora mucronata TaxID=61149 RepID=A0A2P2NFJ3_RHIMU